MSGEVREQTDLATWLLACVAEDEDVAREAAQQVGDSRWEQRSVRIVTTGDREREVADYAVTECIWHIERWDPERGLAECDTKRRIIELHSGAHECSVYDPNGEVNSCRYVNEYENCSTLLLEAQAFVERDGFREEWRDLRLSW